MIWILLFFLWLWLYPVFTHIDMPTFFLPVYLHWTGTTDLHDIAGVSIGFGLPICHPKTWAKYECQAWIKCQTVPSWGSFQTSLLGWTLDMVADHTYWLMIFATFCLIPMIFATSYLILFLFILGYPSGKLTSHIPTPMSGVFVSRIFPKNFPRGESCKVSWRVPGTVWDPSRLFV